MFSSLHRPAAWPAAWLLVALALPGALATPTGPAASELAPPGRAASTPHSAYGATHTFELKRERDGTYALRERVAVRYDAFSERGAANADIFVYEQFFAPVSDLKAEINGRRVPRDRYGQIRPDFEDVFLSSGFAHTVHLGGLVEPGDEVHYGFARAYTDPAYLPVLYVPNADSLRAFEVVVEHPEDVRVRFDVFAPGEAVPYDVDRDARATRLRFDARAGTTPPAHSPFGAYHAAVLMTLVGPNGPVNPVEPNAFGAWYERLVTVPMEGPTLTAQAEALRRDTDLATVRAIYDHVRETVRYIADERDEHAFVPRPPAQTLANGFGDCKDKAFLVRALAAALGLEVQTVLIATTPQPAFAGTNFGLYDHVIAAYDAADGRRYFFDPTARHAPFEALPERVVGGQALVLRDGAAEALVVPAPPRAPDLEVALTGALDALDAAEATVVLRGAYFEEVQRLRLAASALDLENMLAAAVGSLFHTLSFDYFEPVAEDGTSATFRAAADLTDWVIASPTRRYVPQTPFRVFERDVLERDADALPLYLPTRPYITATLALSTPGWTLRPDSARLEARSADGAVLSAYVSVAEAPEPGRLRATYRLDVREKQLADADKVAFVAFVRDYLAARRAMFTLDAAADAAAEDTEPPGAASR